MPLSLTTQVLAFFLMAEIVSGQPTSSTDPCETFIKSTTTTTTTEAPIDLTDGSGKDKRRDFPEKKKDRRSTSSDSDDGQNDGEKQNRDTSMEMDSLSSSESETKKKDTDKNKRQPVSSGDRTGWRKWHRKCIRCDTEMEKKWRDPTIGWICGAYQEARRSFKSACMMRYRNCQDGTMFVKVHNNRCDNRTGTHFLYSYKVVLSIDTTVSKTKTTSEQSKSSSF